MVKEPMNIYELSRSFWDFAFENPDKVRPNHIALYFFAIEHCNRLGWKKKFGLPTTMAMEAIGVRSYNTYTSAFKSLVEWGFIELVQKSTNQHSSNIVALLKNNKAPDKALDRALIKHTSKQRESTEQSTEQSNDSINIPITSIQTNNNTRAFVADANRDLKEYRLYLYNSIKSREISRDQLFLKCKIDRSKRSDLWESFISNSIEHVPMIEDDKHAWNTFKKFVNENKDKYKIKSSNFEGF